ncbi:Abi family protein [Vibrio parahaemolyticus]|uniref:Abi family protein n=1 Tax=Vibrio parahaemolyticus TaxID=670 RepID=UPI002B1ED0FA|nr:Abi family protein [Vibrio parahaemolyticus]MEA5243093.1 Abi family protein [Vibrio parahaemolyticus]
MQPNNYSILFDALSIPRVGAYKHYFGQQLSDDQLFGCYQWNESVSHGFFKLITLIEIVMRNKMHGALSNHYHAHPKKIVRNFKQYPWQFDAYTGLGSQQSCNWYHACNSNGCVLQNKSLSKVHTKTHNPRNGTKWQGSRVPSPDDVVSSLSFGFWSSLVDKCPNIDWDVILVDIFPKHRVSNSNQWSSDIERKKLSYRLDLIRDFRNRIAHHEPIWKFGNLYSEQPPVTNGLLDLTQPRGILDGSPLTPQQSIRRLRSLYSKHLELLRWMSKDIHDDFKGSSLHKQILWLCSNDGLDAHINRNKHTPLSMKTCRFKRELSSILKGKKSAYLHRSGRNVVAIQHIT